jgi:hypothetical protein
LPVGFAFPLPLSPSPSLSVSHTLCLAQYEAAAAFKCFKRSIAASCRGSHRTPAALLLLSAAPVKEGQRETERDRDREREEKGKRKREKATAVVRLILPSHPRRETSRTCRQLAFSSDGALMAWCDGTR